MKLHLPKLLLTAVLAAVGYTGSYSYAGTGLYNGSAYLFGGTNGGGGVNQATTQGITTSTPEGGKLTTYVTTVDSSNAGTSFNVWADDGTNPYTNVVIGEWIVANNTTLSVSESSWTHNNDGTTKRYFDSLNIQHLNAGEGNVKLNINFASHNVDIDKVTGTISNLSNAGTLSIGETGTTTYLSGNLTNTGTQTFNGNVTFVGAGPGNDKTSNTGFVITNAGTTVFKNGTIAGDAEGGILLSVQNGANVVVGGGDTVTTMQLNQLRLHDGSTYSTEVFTIKDNAIVNITGNDAGEVTNTGRWAVVLGHWHNGTSKLNVEGGQLNVLNGTIVLGGDSNSEMNITGGVVNAKAISFDKLEDNDVLNIDGGRLNIGSGGISSTAATRCALNLTSGTLGALAETISIGVVPATIGGQFVIDTAIVDAAGEKTGLLHRFRLQTESR